MSAPLDETAELVVDFCNTFDVEHGTDELVRCESYGAWLASRDMRPTGPPPTPTELANARRLRNALRSCIVGDGCDICDSDAAGARGSNDHNGDDTVNGHGEHGEHGDSIDAMDIPVEIKITTNGLVVLTSDDPLGTIAAAAARLAIEGRFDRLKICPADDCRWAFYDRSRNGSRQWCSMQVCGNRAKVRASRARARVHAAEAPSPAVS